MTLIRTDKERQLADYVVAQSRQLPQYQLDLEWQLGVLVRLAGKAGLYDAQDWLRQTIEAGKKK